MASSGWQGRHDVQTGQYPHIALDLNVQSVSHTGNSLRVVGTIAVINTSGSIDYNGISIWWPNGSGSVDLHGWAEVIAYKNFDTTISLAAGTTSYPFGVQIEAGSVIPYTGTSWTLDVGSGGVAPSGANATFVSQTWNSVTMTSSVSSWGSGYSGTPNLETIVDAGTTSDFGPRIGIRGGTSETSATRTVSNSTKNLEYDGGVNLIGCTKYRLACWASTNVGTVSYISSTTRYTPPAPGQITYTESSVGVFDMEFTGIAANNQANYEAAHLTRTVRYREVGTSAWTNVVVDYLAAMTDVTSFVANVPAGKTYEIEAWMTYHGEQSEVSAITVTNSSFTPHLYASARGVSKEVEKLYGSVNGQTKKIKKLYGSVGGATKLIFEDNS